MKIGRKEIALENRDDPNSGFYALVDEHSDKDNNKSTVIICVGNTKDRISFDTDNYIGCSQDVDIDSNINYRADENKPNKGKKDYSIINCDEIRIHSKDGDIFISSNGNISISSNNEIKINAKNVKINGENLIKGNKFIEYHNNNILPHIHQTPAGPSSPSTQLTLIDDKYLTKE